MPRLYNGVGVGSFLHTEHLTKGIRNVGIAPHRPRTTYSLPALIQHIAGNTIGPHISLTRSYGVAWDYAYDFSHTKPTVSQPAFVLAIDLDYSDLSRFNINVIDPVAEIAKYVNGPLAPTSYHHNGQMDFLLGIVNPTTMSHFTGKAALYPPNTIPIPGPAHTSLELLALVRALRDSEIIVCGSIPGQVVNDIHDVY